MWFGLVFLRFWRFGVILLSIQSAVAPVIKILPLLGFLSFVKPALLGV